MSDLTSEALARLKKATRIANYLQRECGEILDDVLDDDAGLLKAMPEEWWITAAYRAGAYWKKAPSETTRALVASLLLARREPDGDPFEGIVTNTEAQEIHFRGCVEVVDRKERV